MKLRIPAFDEASVLVVGDVMLDRYWFGEATRISPEAPVPVLDVRSSEERPGGAANVALNVAALGAPCMLVGAVGDDAEADLLEARLAAAGVVGALVRVPGWPTIVKLRAVSRKQQLLRADFERALPRPVQGELERRVRERIARARVLILEDYDKGTLHEPARLIDLAHAAGCTVVVDPKFKPPQAYRGADVFKPNRVELERATGGWRDYRDLVAKAADLAGNCEFGALVITRGAQGVTVVERGGAHAHMPAREVDVFDETGAGDTVAAILGAGLAAGLDVYQSASLANVAAGLAVRKLGTATVSQPELERALDAGTHSDRGILTEEELADAMSAARRAGQRIVFTNGCFDVLHAGHVHYLEEARTLGDRLIVAVNDDASVTRLKGHGRPVNALNQRLDVIAGLAAVDWVVSFADDTPCRLLESLKPDVLVKGGDYALEDVVGAEIVRAYGGTVRVLAHVPGVSTRAMIERMKGNDRN